MRETVIDRRKTVAWKTEIGLLEGVDAFNNKEHLRKWREIQQTNNVLQRPEIYRSQERKKPRFAARPYEYWCPDSESNQGHGDFQSPALPTELSGQRGALNRNHARQST